MPTVTNVSVIRDDPQRNGSRYVEYRYDLLDNQENVGTKFVGPKSVSASFDALADAQGRVIEVFAGLAEQEASALMGLIDIVNPLTYTQNPAWSTTKDIAKAAIRWMMSERDPRIVIYLEPLIVYIQENYNAAQVAAFLDITSEQVVKMNSRINAILAPSTDSVKDQLVLFDAEREDI